VACNLFPFGACNFFVAMACQMRLYSTQQSFVILPILGICQFLTVFWDFQRAKSSFFVCLFVLMYRFLTLWHQISHTLRPDENAKPCNVGNSEQHKFRPN
jgi:hypothetical protein